MVTWFIPDDAAVVVTLELTDWGCEPERSREAEEHIRRKPTASSSP
jgi:hypothetical protein